ncbi:MAG: hypothetical protein WBV96_05350, partial [Polyangia bacterium]
MANITSASSAKPEKSVVRAPAIRQEQPPLLPAAVLGVLVAVPPAPEFPPVAATLPPDPTGPVSTGPPPPDDDVPVLIAPPAAVLPPVFTLV